MVMDLAVELIQATVQLEQPLGDGTRTVGTGFLISAPGPDGQPRTVLITANHVFQKMPGPNARIGFGAAINLHRYVALGVSAGYLLGLLNEKQDIGALQIFDATSFLQLQF